VATTDLLRQVGEGHGQRDSAIRRTGNEADLIQESEPCGLASDLWVGAALILSQEVYFYGGAICWHPPHSAAVKWRIVSVCILPVVGEGTDAGRGQSTRREPVQLQFLARSDAARVGHDRLIIQNAVSTPAVAQIPQTDDLVIGAPRGTETQWKVRLQIYKSVVSCIHHQHCHAANGHQVPRLVLKISRDNGYG